ncbi:MAG TPA: hypothetical protein VF189_06645 [Patescibacteria group bacterium]
MSFARLENVRLVSRSLIGNALENTKSTFGAYIESVGRENPTQYNPKGEEIAANLVELTHKALLEKDSQDSLLSIPWSTRRGFRVEKVHPSRLASSLIAYADSQGKKLADEYFPTAEIKEFLNEVKNKAQENEKPLTVPEQFEVALNLTDNNPLAASILAHSAYRAIARVKDTRISPDLEFSLDEMMDISRSTADFYTNDSPSRDPLGDTYHWWASHTAGLGFTLSKENFPKTSRMLTWMFYNSAAITTFVRKTILHKTNLANHHKDVDRQGLQVGITLGEFLKNIN